MKSEKLEMPPIKGVRLWSKLSSLFSLLSLCIVIINFEFFNQIKGIPFFIRSDIGLFIAFIFSIISYGCLILDIDVPGRLGNQLAKRNQLLELGINKLKRSRIWILICYTFTYTMGNFLIDLFKSFNFYNLIGFLISFIIIISTLNKFRNIIHGSENLDLISRVDASYMMGFLFSLILGIGGEFYLNIWIFLINLAKKFGNREKKGKKFKEKHYWDKIIKIEFREPLKKILSGLMLFDLFIYFIFIKDIQDLVIIIADNPSALIGPVIFLLFPLLTKGLKSVNFASRSKFTLNKAYICLVAIKFILLGILYLTIPFTRNTCRFSNIDNSGELDVVALLFTAAIISPLLYIIIPISIYADKAKNDRKVILFKKYYRYYIASILAFLLVITIIFSMISPLYQIYLIFVASGIIFPLFAFIEIPNYNLYLEELYSDESRPANINNKKLIVLCFLTIICSWLCLNYLSFISFLIPFLANAIIAVPLISTVVIICLIGMMILKTKTELIILCNLSSLIAMMFWAAILFLANINIEFFLLSFIITLIFTGALSIIFFISPLKRDKKAKNREKI
ncbi:MAG: hypothetical protein ACTSRP_08750 [Candidatus Helarchaeota archaeon]